MLNKTANTMHRLTNIPPLHQNFSGVKSILTSIICGSADIPKYSTKNRIRDNIIFQPITTISSAE